MKRRFSSNLISGSLIVVCSFLFSGVAVGDTFYVNPDGSADFTTIQAAIDDAGTGTGDIIIVQPGTYVENINLSGKSITLRSSDPTNPAVVTSTIIDGGANGRVIICNSGEDPNTVISGFVITNGDATASGLGGGILNENSSPTVTHCTLTENISDGGGGMYNINSSPIVTYCTFTENKAASGGGMHNDNSSPIISNCTFSKNTTNRTDQGYGGGMYNRNGSSPIITYCTFTENVISVESALGGGMYNRESSPTISYCTFSKNTARHAGGMYNANCPSLIITHCTFIANIAYDTNGYGGGMNNAYSSINLSHCTFIANTASSGGGIRNFSSSPVVEDCVFSANRANGGLGSGGGMYNNYSSPPVTGCTFSLNIAKYRGGGMYNNESDPNVIDCTFTQNRTENDGGAGIFNFSSSSTTIIRCAFVANSAGIHGGGVESSYHFEPIVSVADCYFCYNLPQAIYNSYFDAGGNHLNYCQPPSPIDPGIEGDVDGDGDVDMIDFSLLAGNWLAGT